MENRLMILILSFVIVLAFTGCNKEVIAPSEVVSETTTTKNGNKLGDYVTEEVTNDKGELVTNKEGEPLTKVVPSENHKETTTKEQGKDNRCQHVYKGVVTQEATCTKDGVMTYTCSKCKDSYTEAIAKKGHNYEGVATKKATCTENGVMEYTCTRCGNSYSETIKATGHAFSGDKCTKCNAPNPNYTPPANAVTKADADALLSKIISYSNSKGLVQDTIARDYGSYNTMCCRIDSWNTVDSAYASACSYIDGKAIAYGKAINYYVTYNYSNDGYTFVYYYL